MGQAFAVAVGAALGGLLRWGLSHIAAPISSGFPWGILFINLLGSLLIGVCYGFFRNTRADEAWALFWMVGVLGGFTTFSSFSLDMLKMGLAGRWGVVLAYAVASCVGGILMAALGAWMTQGINQA